MSASYHVLKKIQNNINFLKMISIDFLNVEIIYGSKREYKKSLLLYYLTCTRFLKKTNWLKNEIKNIKKEEVVIQNKLGKFFVYTNTDSIIKSSYLFEYLVRDWLKLDTKKDFFIDIGANIGFYSILANKFSFKKIISFEANPYTFNILEKNINLNNISNVELNNIGLDYDVRDLPFHVHDDKGSCKFLIGDELKNHDIKNIITLQTISFDKYASNKNFNVTDISFIKIDVEGFEYNVLKGMEKTLKNLPSKTKIFIEIWDNNLSYKTFEILKKNDFELLHKLSDNYLFEKK